MEMAAIRGEFRNTSECAFGDHCGHGDNIDITGTGELERGTAE